VIQNRSMNQRLEELAVAAPVAVEQGSLERWIPW
jgi:hypothetical protein